jgi:EAL domain-containing protein (putative c-di-GMP-specific phosphodiesterase class I)
VQTEAARPDPESRAVVGYEPILDVARGVVAGFQAQPRRDSGAALDGAEGIRSAQVITAALADAPTSIPNAFLTVPVPVAVVADSAVRAALRARGSLAGVVLDLTGPFAATPDPEVAAAVADYRAAGALVAVGGYGTSQPPLASIASFRPSILRVGRDWVRGIDRSQALGSTMRLVARLAEHLDSWLLAEGVNTAGELRALAELDVPLAQGPFITAAHGDAPQPDTSALRALLQPAVTMRRPDQLPHELDVQVAVVVDENNRPLTLFERAPSGEWAQREVLPVEITLSVAEAVRRAVRRPPGYRFTPLACVDQDGRLLGVLRLEHLLAQLTGGA